MYRPACKWNKITFSENGFCKFNYESFWTFNRVSTRKQSKRRSKLPTSRWHASSNVEDLISKPATNLALIASIAVLRLTDVYEYPDKNKILPLTSDLRMHFYGNKLYWCRDHCYVVIFEGSQGWSR